MDEKVKTLKYRVNAGTWPCATHANERWPAAVVPRPSIAASPTQAMELLHQLNVQLFPLQTPDLR
jgi:hypothetical protein